MSSIIDESTVLSILKSKCIRIVESYDYPSISFLLILLSSGGMILNYSLNDSFEIFRSKYGDAEFLVTLKELEHKAIIQKKDNLLQFANLDPFSDAIKELCVSIGNLVMKVRKHNIFSMLNQYLGNPEGKLVIDTLLSLGRSLDLDQLESVVGGDYLRETIGKLCGEEILFKHRYASRKYDYYYYKFLPGIDILLEEAKKSEFDQKTIDALIFIYISQNIREDGVLQSDCLDFEDQIPSLLLHGLIRENHWYLYQYLTTQEGAKLAREELQKRINDKRAEIDSFVTKLPREFISFILEKYVAKNISQPEEAISEANYYACIVAKRYDCLLSNLHIDRLRKEFFENLISLGLTTKVHKYVSTHGGETRGLHYCIPYEMFILLHQYYISEEKCLSDTEERSHRLFHILKEVENLQYIQDERVLSERLERQLVECELTCDEFGSAINALIIEGMIDRQGNVLRVKVPLRVFEDVLKTRFLNPIIERLSGRQPISPQITIKLPKLISERKIMAGQEALAEKIIEEWLQKMDQEVIGELLYIDRTTFSYLDMVPKSCGIKLLVGHIKDLDKCLKMARKVAAGRPYFTIAKIILPGPEVERPRMHERWLASSQFEIEIGHDLKSDSLGSSEHTMRLYEDARNSDRYRRFFTKWNADALELQRLYGQGARREVIFELKL